MGCVHEAKEGLEFVALFRFARSSTMAAGILVAAVSHKTLPLK